MGRKRKTPAAPPADPPTSDTEDGGEVEEGCGRRSRGGGEGPGTRGAVIKGHGANERERARMRVLSKAFGRLKTTLPWVPADTKLSKLDTLRLASSYIAHLRRVLQVDGGEEVPAFTGLGAGAAGGQEVGAGTAPRDTRGARTSIHPIALVSLCS